MTHRNLNISNKIPYINLSPQVKSPQGHNYSDEKMKFINSSSKKSIQTYRQFQKLVIETDQIENQQEQKNIHISILNSKMTLSQAKCAFGLSDANKNTFKRQCKTKLHQLTKYLKQYQSMAVPKKSKRQLQNRDLMVNNFEARRKIKNQKIKGQVLQRIQDDSKQNAGVLGKQQESLTQRQGRVKGFIQRQLFYNQQRKVLCEMRQFCIYGIVKSNHKI